MQFLSLSEQLTTILQCLFEKYIGIVYVCVISKKRSLLIRNMIIHELMNNEMFLDSSLDTLDSKKNRLHEQQKPFVLVSTFLCLS